MSLNGITSSILKRVIPDGKYETNQITVALRAKAYKAAAQVYLCNPTNVPIRISSQVEELTQLILSRLPQDIHDKNEWDRDFLFHQIAQPILAPYIMLQRKIYKRFGIPSSLPLVTDSKDYQTAIKQAPVQTDLEEKKIRDLFFQILEKLPKKIYQCDDWPKIIDKLQETALRFRIQDTEGRVEDNKDSSPQAENSLCDLFESIETAPVSNFVRKSSQGGTT